MAKRTATLEYRAIGAGTTAREVHSLSDALRQQRAQAGAMGPALKAAGAANGALGATAMASRSRLTAFTGALGPAGAGLIGLGYSAREGAASLVRYSAAVERASFLSRTLNGALLAGGAVMATAGVAAIAYADDAIRMGDSYASLIARIRQVSDSQEAAVQTEGRLFEISKQTRSGISETVQLYARLAPAIRDAGRAQEDALRVTDLALKAQAIGGATQQESAAATVQFSQGIGRGIIRGDEFNSLMESAPALMRQIATGMAVPFSALKTMAEEGELTAERVMTALLKMGPEIDEAFKLAPKTAAQSWRLLSDEVMKTVGELMAVSGAQGGIVGWLDEASAKMASFREELVADPDMLDGFERGLELVADLVGSIANLGGDALQHLDLIIQAGQALIALKLGSVLAGAFVTVAQQVRAANTALADYGRQARLVAGGVRAPAQANLAVGLRAREREETARALALESQATQQAAAATRAKALADRAAAQATALKAQGSKAATAAANTEAAAQILNTQATRAQALADRTGERAAISKAVATAAATEAAAAETVVLRQSTTAQVAKNAAVRAGGVAWTAMGGAVGAATLVLGAALWAVTRATMQAQQNAEALARGWKIVDEMNEEASDSSNDLATGLDNAAAAASRAETASRRYAGALAEQRKEALLAAVAAQEGNVAAAETAVRQARMGTLDTETGQMIRGPQELVDAQLKDLQQAEYRRSLLLEKYYEAAAKGSGGGRRGGGTGATGPGFRGGAAQPGQAASSGATPAGDKANDRAASAAAREAEQAAQAHARALERLEEIQTEMSGGSIEALRRERELAELRQAAPAEVAAIEDAVRRYYATQDQARRLNAALQVAEPAAREAFDVVTAGVVVPTDSRGVPDGVAAAAQLASLREQIFAESENRIRADMARKRARGEIEEQQYAARLADAIAANRIAVETVVQDRLLQLEQDRLRAASEYAERRYAETADTIVGALDAARRGDWADAGKALVDDLLNAAWQELIANPLRKAIIDMLRDTFSPQAGGASGGGVASFLGRVLGTMMGGGGAAASGMPGPVVVPYGPAMASGGWVNGPGGPRDDKVPARLSNGEFVVQAKAARDWGPVLEMINRGAEPSRFAQGGWAGGAPAGGGSSMRPELKVEVHDHTGQNLRKEVTPTSDGMRVDLYEQVGRSMISNAAQNGDLVKALQRSPSGHKKRG